MKHPLFKGSRAILAVLLLVGGAVGCATTREGYVYSPTQTGRGSIAFDDALEDAGAVHATLASGESCRGRFRTVPGRNVTWDDQEPFRIYSEDTQAGMAVLECAAGHVVRCEFSREKSGGGMGQCTDGNGSRETIYF